MNDNGTARTLKTIGMIVIVLCIIGGIVLGFQTAEGYSSFNLGIALGCWLSGFISGVLIFAFGEVVDLLQLNADRQAQIIEKLDKMPRQEVEKVIYSKPKTTKAAPIADKNNIIESDNGYNDADRIMKLFDKN